MKKQAEAFCPGCSRHCPAGAPCCGYGRKYFERSQKGKWKAYAAENGVMWTLILTAKACKKALGPNVGEMQLLSGLGEEEQKTLMNLLAKVNAEAQKSLKK